MWAINPAPAGGVAELVEPRMRLECELSNQARSAGAEASPAASARVRTACNNRWESAALDEVHPTGILPPHGGARTRRRGARSAAS
jgi:hypothetical protein